MKRSSKVFLSLYMFVLLNHESNAQVNLVPNPSFEIHDSCPTLNSPLNLANSWVGYQRSPDYLHSCASVWTASVPRNFVGFQPPYSVYDSAYVAIGTSRSRTEAREVIGAHLVQPLIVGQRYFVSFLVSCGYQNPQNVCFSDKLGVKFITYIDSLSSSNTDTTLFNNIAHIYCDSILSDTTNWIPFKGSFVADSAYNGILIGIFFSVNNIQTFCDPPTGAFAYYYIDHVCVSEDSLVCSFLNSGTNAIPVPDKVIVHYEGGQIKVLISKLPSFLNAELYDVSGRLIWVKMISQNETYIDINDLPTGLYLLRIDGSTFKFIH